MYEFSIFEIVDHFIRHNPFEFEIQAESQLSAKIMIYTLQNCFNVNLDERLLNRLLFKDTFVLFVLNSFLKSIEENVFKKFINLRVIAFYW
jgi:hypothetical protein